MIFPKEYKTIGWAEAGKTTSDEQKRIYFLSEYILEKTAEGYNLYEVGNEGDGFIRKPSGSKLIAGADEIIVCEEMMNIKNRTFLIQTASKLIGAENETRKQASRKQATTVVFTGIDRHLTFVKDPDLSEILEIEVIDVVPPEPAWLANCIKRMDAANLFGDLQISLTEKIADLSVYQSDKTIYPCHSSGLAGKFLDSDRIDETEDGWTLVGCDTSKKIVETIYPNLKYEFIDMCPMRSDLTKPEKPFIMRCCKSENSGKMIQINGQKGVIVHWGAGEWQIAESVRKLAFELREND
ncbi:hypothetical protein MmiAt1_09160 [Methanimicrococcus sp. At1]|uniref:Uncharacterized protein n=1 Tax=Methanimicrococcus hacksteinii TaxID=3028293 RepID=A0ABU3VPJ6_9EURY|nr:hypothetical protein [Methanimicrococcus sp. At1]MDV0445342.1 hypothetical protein [Methanimicrococcus sp. At1]